MNLAEVISHWVGRVEIVLAGADEQLRAGEEALAAGDPIAARTAARRVLERAPHSPVGLALLADACDAAHLDAELALTLEELARRAPSRAEVWVRLARTRRAIGASTSETRSTLLRALAVAEAGSSARVDALLALADLDLADRDGARAELWLSRIVGDSPGATLRRAEARLLRGDPKGARALLEPIVWEPADARAALALGRTRGELGDVEAFAPLLRAFVLDEPGASEALSGALGRLPTETQIRARVRLIVDAKGEQSLVRWRSAFATAEGARDAARLALRAALRDGEPDAARALLEASIADQDAVGLAEALQSLPESHDALVLAGRAMSTALALSPEHGDEALRFVADVIHPRAVAWATTIAESVVRRWVPASGTASHWAQVVSRLDDHAHALGDAAAAATVATLSAERSSPLVMAVIGEFNAGKSTFINALLGESIAPTGILPTTAVLHHLRWAPDSMAVARVFLTTPHRPRERIVAPGDLRETLSRIEAGHVERVEIRMPLASLARVEVLDTPGFNANVAEHAAVAWSALDQADVAVWLVDATQALKQSERRVLEEASRRGLPVQVFVNKADRVHADDRSRVLASVEEGLASMGVRSWRPPCALSSRLALAGRLGDAEALRESGWEAARAVLEEGIVAQADALKELSLRRSARGVVENLRAGYLTRLAVEDVAARRSVDAAQLAARAATEIEQDAEGLARDLAVKLDTPARSWAKDLGMVFVGRDTPDGVGKADPMLERYRVDSALVGVAPPLLRELALLVPHSLRAALDAGPLPAVVRATIRAAAVGAASDRDPEGFVLAVCRGSLFSLVEQLLAHAAASEPPRTTSSGALRELASFAAALE